MKSNFEYTTTLQYRVKALSHEVEAFKVGETYKKMEADHRKMIRHYERMVAQLRCELAKAHSETVTMREYWFQVYEEVEKNKKLTAQVNRDFENSSIPSSMKIIRKKITNTREKTGCCIAILIASHSSLFSNVNSD